MNKNVKIICCLLGGVVGMVINVYFNQSPHAFDFALAALIGSGVTSWIIDTV